MSKTLFDRCPDCGAQVDDLPGPEDDDAVECPACPWKGTVDELTLAVTRDEFIRDLVGAHELPELFESSAYPVRTLRRFREIQRVLPVGAVVDPLGMGREHYLVVVGLEMAPVLPGMAEDQYFALHTARLDGGAFYRSSRMSFEELRLYAGQVVGFLAELVPHNATEAGL